MRTCGRLALVEGMTLTIRYTTELPMNKRQPRRSCHPKPIPTHLADIRLRVRVIGLPTFEKARKLASQRLIQFNMLVVAEACRPRLARLSWELNSNWE